MAKGKKKQYTKTIRLRADSTLNQKIIDNLEELFMMASPKALHESLNFVFFQYLFLTEEDGYPTGFRHISEDFYILLKLFGEVDCSVYEDYKSSTHTRGYRYFKKSKKSTRFAIVIMDIWSIGHIQLLHTI